MKTINLHIYEKNIIPVLYTKQGDVGRKFQAVVVDGIPDGVTFSVWYSGASGEGNYTAIGERSAFSIQGNTITVELITQMLTNAGPGRLCLVMSGADGSQLATWNIPYEVESVPGMGSAAAEQYYTALSESASKAIEAARRAEAAAEGFVIDASLSQSGQSADAAAVGAELAKKADAKATGDALAKKAEYVLLWSNASKTSAFVGQSLAVSTVGYDYLMIVCGYGTYARNGTTATHYRLRPIGDGDTEVGLAVNYISDTLGLSIPFRKLVVSSNRKSLTFDTGHRSDGTEDNAYCIPYYIYGIKGVSNQ